MGLDSPLRHGSSTGLENGTTDRVTSTFYYKAMRGLSTTVAYNGPLTERASEE